MSMDGRRRKTSLSAEFSGYFEEVQFLLWEVLVKYFIVYGVQCLVFITLWINSNNDIYLNTDYFYPLDLIFLFFKLITRFQIFYMSVRLIIRFLRTVFKMRMPEQKYTFSNQFLILAVFSLICLFLPPILRFILSWVFYFISYGFIVHYFIGLGISGIKIAVFFETMCNNRLARPILGIFLFLGYITACVFAWFHITWWQIFSLGIPLLTLSSLVTMQNITTFSDYDRYFRELLLLGSADVSWIFFSFITHYSRREAIFCDYWIPSFFGLAVCLVPMCILIYEYNRNGIDDQFFTSSFVASCFSSSFLYMYLSSLQFQLFYRCLPSLICILFLFNFDQSIWDEGHRELIALLNKLEIVYTRKLEFPHRLHVSHPGHFIQNDWNTWKTFYSGSKWQTRVLLLSNDDHKLPFVEDSDESINLALEFSDCEIKTNLTTLRCFRHWFPRSIRNCRRRRRSGVYVIRIDEDIIIDQNVFIEFLSGKTNEDNDNIIIEDSNILSFYLLFSHLKMTRHVFLICCLIERVTNVHFLLFLYSECKKRFEDKTEISSPHLISDYDEEYIRREIPRHFESPLSLAVFKRLKDLNVTEIDGVTRILENLHILRHFDEQRDWNVSDHHSFRSIKKRGFNKTVKEYFIEIYQKKGNVNVITTDGYSLNIHIEILILRSNFFYLMCHFKGHEYEMLKNRKRIIMSRKVEDGITLEVLQCLKCFFYFGHFDPSGEPLSLKTLLLLLLHCDKYGERELERQVFEVLVEQSRDDYHQKLCFLRKLRRLDTWVLESNENIRNKVLEVWVGRASIPGINLDVVLEERREKYEKIMKKKKSGRKRKRRNLGIWNWFF